MFQVLLKEGICSAGMFLFWGISIALLIFLQVEYRIFLKESENMSTTGKKELRAIKTKFLNSYGKKETEDETKYQIQEQINVEVFVDKSINRIKFCGLRPHKWYFLCGQSIIASILCAGIGIFRCLVNGMTLREVSPFYLFAFLELYVYFSTVSILDFREKDRNLRLNIIEYVENHMLNRMQISDAFDKEEELLHTIKEQLEKKKTFSKEMEQELDALLQEFLV